MRAGVQVLWRGCQPFTAPTGSGRPHGHAFHPVRGGGVLGLSEAGRKERFGEKYLKVYADDELPAERVYEFVRAALATFRRSGLGLGLGVAGSK